MTQDGEDNFLEYRRDDMIPSHILFGDFVKLLYDLKKLGGEYKYAKKFLINIWGALGQQNVIKVCTSKNKPPVEIRDDKVLVSMNRLNDDESMVSFYPRQNPFYSNYARLKPFLLSKGRQKILRTISSLRGEDDVIWGHTDGFTTRAEHKELKLGTNLGDLEYEGFIEHYTVHNVNLRFNDLESLKSFEALRLCRLSK
jgi:hypothetical protein